MIKLTSTLTLGGPIISPITSKPPPPTPDRTRIIFQRPSPLCLDPSPFPVPLVKNVAGTTCDALGLGNSNVDSNCGGRMGTAITPVEVGAGSRGGAGLPRGKSTEYRDDDHDGKTAVILAASWSLGLDDDTAATEEALKAGTASSDPESCDPPPASEARVAGAGAGAVTVAWRLGAKAATFPLAVAFPIPLSLSFPIPIPVSVSVSVPAPIPAPIPIPIPVPIPVPIPASASAPALLTAFLPTPFSTLLPSPFPALSVRRPVHLSIRLCVPRVPCIPCVVLRILKPEAPG
ncbi:hypothetical protein BC937DRAFT_88925 [Endogone sp. FLAS-F59071]|nr:hypothetical protein BC937DRAFT_88925 [Endogone sp. FLAS-F59071]|eukprot:RUS18318.1 hypothetical protein BC937DRAFT_88925 [Endogone sp. FLAS-F59071]